MLASAVFAASLALTGAYAAPVVSNLVTVEAALAPSNVTHYNASVVTYEMNGNAGACGLWDSDSSLVAGLPLEQYTDLDSVSAFCGSFIVVVDPRTNLSVTARVSDASTENSTLSLSQGSYAALNGTDSSLKNVTWYFANSTETAAAKEALSSSSTSSYVAAATTTVAAASASSSAAYVAPSSSAKTTTTSAYVAPSSTKTSTYVAPSTTSAADEYKLNAQATTTSTKVYTTTTSAYVAPTTTTTTNVAPTTTTTTYQAAATTKAATSYSSSSSSSYSGTATYFYQNGVAGACGTVHSDSDYVVALETSMYASGAHCGQYITASANGKSVTLLVADECPSCVSTGSIDLSEGAFLQLASLDAGVASVTWSFN